jgi:hypothetical protein
MARTEMDMGTYDGVNVNFIINDDEIAVGTLTVPGILSLKNENSHPVIEFEGQIDSKLNIMPSNFNFKKINSGDTKTIHLVLNVPESTEPGTYEIKINLDFKIDTPPTTTRALMITVTKALE